MNSEVLNRQDLLFEEELILAEVKEYGFGWQKFSSGKFPIPAEGLRFDIRFEGHMIGKRINGHIEGVDHLTVRADGRLFLDLYASIKTKDGASISVKESGINAEGALRLGMDFHTSDPRYKWLNHKHVWGVGAVDFQSGTVKIKGYQNQNY